jgi:hypothetical protein
MIIHVAPRNPSIFRNSLFLCYDLELHQTGGRKDWRADRQLRMEFPLVGNAETGSGLVHDEADLALAVQSAYGIVLTDERSTKDGPLQYAARKGGKVLYLKHFESSGLSLRAFISAFHDKD